ARGQWGDHFEQFVWAHSVEWGYHKHPPLPTWILSGTIALFEPATHWALVLAALCSLGTAFFTYRIALELIGRPLAVLALMLWGLQQPFSNRAFLFNHNTVMMLGVSATAWCLLEALKTPTSRGWWMGVGALTALSMLSKYQAAVPLSGLIAAAWLSGELASRSARTGLLLAALLAMAILAPHVAWVFQHHLTTLAYAAQADRVLSLWGRAWNVTSFLAQQVRLLFPALLFAGLLMLAPRRPTAGRGMEVEGGERRQRAWLFGLIGFPLAATVLTSPLLGLELQNHWGYQALQFASLWLAWRMRRVLPLPLGGLAVLGAVLLHATFISLALSPGVAKGSRQDSHFPAQELADAVRHDWQDEAPCPLVYVVGPTFEAGIVSVYNGGTAAVLEDGTFLKSPWIEPSDLRRRGAVYVAASPTGLPSRGVVRTGFLDVSTVSPAPQNRVYWAVVPPEKCADSP
ncbi:MAG: glycosyltransferase family 39 protein, partial [Candidatus Dormibacteraeota bacterium]|nr:glycosyltransferase family 39 protein [Candidatus Dormibacteraeota bacterium]